MLLGRATSPYCLWISNIPTTNPSYLLIRFSYTIKCKCYRRFMGGGLSHLLFQKVTEQVSSITSPVKDCYIFNILIILKCPITVNIFLSIRNGDCLLRQSPNNCVAETKHGNTNALIFHTRPINPTLFVSSSVLLTTLVEFLHIGWRNLPIWSHWW